MHRSRRVNRMGQVAGPAHRGACGHDKAQGKHHPRANTDRSDGWADEQEVCCRSFGCAHSTSCHMSRDTVPPEFPSQHLDSPPPLSSLPAPPARQRRSSARPTAASAGEHGQQSGSWSQLTVQCGQPVLATQRAALQHAPQRRQSQEGGRQGPQMSRPDCHTCMFTLHGLHTTLSASVPPVRKQHPPAA